MTRPARYEDDLMMFFDPRPGAASLYRAIEAMVEEVCPDCSVRVQKSQISFTGRHLFAMVSLPRRKRDEGLLFTLGLGRPLASPRVAYQSEPYPGRFTLHIPVTRPEELDAELRAWLQEAWTFGESK